MQHVLWLLAAVVGILAMASVVVYAPFAKDWLRALLVPFLLTSLWGILRLLAILVFREEQPPMMGFVILPPLFSAYAATARALKLILVRSPKLSKLEEKTRSFFGKAWHKRRYRREDNVKGGNA